MNTLKTLLIGALLLPASFAGATVTYTFDALSSFPIDATDTSPGVPSIQASFTVTAPSYITADTTFQPADFDSCAVTTPSTGFVCDSSKFTVNTDVTPYDYIGFGLHPDPATASSYSLFYYFAPGAFTADGTYDSVLLGSDQAGTLTVSSVPEPETLAMVLCGVGFISFAGRRTRLYK